MYNLYKAKKHSLISNDSNNLWRNLIYVYLRSYFLSISDRQPAVLNKEIVALTGLLNFNIRNNSVVPNCVTSHQKPPKDPPQPCHNRHRRHCLSSFSRFLVDLEQTLNFFYLNFNLFGDDSDWVSEQIQNKFWASCALLKNTFSLSQYQAGLLTGDAIGLSRRCHFWPSAYVFATYEGVSAPALRQQTQTDAITP